MKSAYQNKEFATFWNDISGSNGQTYKQYVVDPEMFKLMGSLKGKSILDLGCGNGYLGPIFIRKGANQVTLMDISKSNIDIAKSRNASQKVKFICQDATKKWQLKSNSLDFVFSDMMLNEVKNIKNPIREAARVLKKNGKFVFAITHPAWDLFEYSKKKFTGSSLIIPDAGPYFFRGYNYFVMSTESLKPKQGMEYQKNYLVEHYQRPLQDYFNAIVETGFNIEKVIEPQLPTTVLKAYPRYKEMSDHPIGLIVSARKRS